MSITVANNRREHQHTRERDEMVFGMQDAASLSGGTPKSIKNYEAKGLVNLEKPIIADTVIWIKLVRELTDIGMRLVDIKNIMAQLQRGLKGVCSQYLLIYQREKDGIWEVKYSNQGLTLNDTYHSAWYLNLKSVNKTRRQLRRFSNPVNTMVRRNKKTYYRRSA